MERNGMMKIAQYYREGLAYFQARADRDIAQIRTGDFTVTVTDAAGQPLAGRPVHLQHETHDFDFGANLFMLEQYEQPEQNARYAQAWRRLFNTGVVSLYWEGTEPQQGVLRYAADTANDVYRRPPADRVVEWCRQNGVRAKGHPLFWHEFLPQWLPEDWPTLYPLIEKRFREIAGRYAGCIPVFDCVNEPARVWDVHREHQHRQDNWKHLVPPRDYVKTIFDLARRYFPQNALVLNEAVGAAFAEYHGRYSAYYLNIRDLLSRGTPIDRIGLQCHTYDSAAFHNVYDAERLYDVLDTYAEFGKPLVLSEVSIPSEPDEEFQAEAAVYLYKVCFSHRNVDGIFWWNLTDDGVLTTRRRALGENLPSTGLIDGDYREKPAYRALDRLINREWRTTVDAQTDAAGCVHFHGYNGSYAMEIDGRRSRLHLSGETGETQQTVVVSAAER